ncbi:preprotein translocase subunit SecA [Ignatzschineria cameli]|uniref:Protein translocase subunit SecA n=2 Tax=Bacteria TaxID=2 RepID=A0A2U2ATL1_9GAMM|nr:preprotein translocase subunit SecA [Ignatzschineria cameli]PWD87485.1 preprotein translocase subunit SecA [Ignatzschineria cameli]PWD88016.1 preprotein translocase subunit SecA [Ignatzschineria cameli]PWD91048.1 preprotein translocase subunit SecA [Ignatzschineria cameli]PWD92690.1 preprotein translocase subunit SecA [Ignatzschineria cameli]PWD93710.1 preprotein translocase subunit SecA [Ignatzschineria cameli]
MINKLIRKIFGTRNDRLIKEARGYVAKVNALEDKMRAMSEEELKGQTTLFKERLAKGETLDDLLPEAFATMREASSRVMGMRHYDVQLIGGYMLHQGRIAEMRTGEGKTLVATLAVYLNALAGKGVHVVTVNDYLARRDAEWMGKVYNYLGLSVGVVVSNQSLEEKKAAYQADITYATNNELGFDYLRDNMVYDMSQKVQRPLSFAVIDEVDSILIDEARTPLIISGPVEGGADLYHAVNKLIPYLKKPTEEGPVDFEINEKDKQVNLTEEGHQHLESLLVEAGLLKEGDSLYDSNNLKLYHHVDNCLRAHYIFQRDVDYIVQKGEIVIVDEHTGRTLAGRRWSDGLHQAIEVKEGVEVKPENQTLASITFQNYFRIYEKLAGMTGTADTEAPEFLEIYGLEVVVIPTHKPVQRKDYGDLIYLTQKEKYEAIIKDILDCYERKQPVLVGTASVEVSELISDLLKKQNIPHEVLNAKQHEREAYVVGRAGVPGAITIATNMAGRGTDIVLGGNVKLEEQLFLESNPNATEKDLEEIRARAKERQEQVLALGGLHIIGTERHESRRIDNQLRGRAGRQGDVGSSRFYLSLDDHLMRIFMNPKMRNLMASLGMGNGEALEHRMITRSIENAQRKVEGHNFDIRKNLLQYDDIANDQRKIIYQQRDDILRADDITNAINMMREQVFGDLVEKFIPPQSYAEQWDLAGLMDVLKNEFRIEIDFEKALKENPNLTEEEIYNAIIAESERQYAEKKKQANADVDPSQFRRFEKSVLLEVLDSQWKEHLAAMDYLRQGIQLRAYGQRRPEQEYKRESFILFEAMLEQIHYKTIRFLSNIVIRVETPEELSEALSAPEKSEKKVIEGSVTNAADVERLIDEIGNISEENIAETEAEIKADMDSGAFAQVGRNEPCPCGSGKRYKDCHGKIS